MNDTHAPAGERLSVGDIQLEVIHHGAGRPVLLLHGMHNVDPQARFLDLLGSRAEVIAPSHPGFGHSTRPADFDTVYDLVHLYVDILDSLPYANMPSFCLARHRQPLLHRSTTRHPSRRPRPRDQPAATLDSLQTQISPLPRLS